MIPKSAATYRFFRDWGEEEGFQVLRLHGCHPRALWTTLSRLDTQGSEDWRERPVTGGGKGWRSQWGRGAVREVGQKE